MGMINVGELFSHALGKEKTVLKKMPIKDAIRVITQEEADELVDKAQVVNDAIKAVEQHGIVFVDEIDKICNSHEKYRSSVSQEGVQRDLLPLIEGTSVATKYGQVQTDHILFIASGAFQIASPSDLLPELQGRLPIRVHLNPLSKSDFVRILTEPEANLVTQAVALLGIEGVTLNFTSEAIEAIASIAVNMNDSVENIGARRLYTVLEKLLEDINFNADKRSGEEIELTAEFVSSQLSGLQIWPDFNRFIL
jgi:ATP-dependent HslUV protease ATP-binding subunit HslU